MINFTHVFIIRKVYFMLKIFKKFLGLLAIGFCITPISVHADDLPVISIVGVKVDTKQFNGEQISKALDEYVSPLIGGHVQLEFIELENYDQIFSKYDVSDRMPDVFFVPSAEHLQTFQEHGRVLPIGNLLETYGQGILKEMGEEMLQPQIIDDEIYAVPCIHDLPTCNGFEYRVSIAEKYGLHMEEVKTFDDLTAVFQTLSEKAPDIIPCSDLYFQIWDPLSDSLGVLMDYGAFVQVTNLYASDFYKKYYEYVYQWREKGYLLSEDIGLLSGNRYVNSPEIFGKFTGFHPGLTYVDSAEAGEEIGCVQLTPSFLCSTNTGMMRSNSFAVSSSCSYPDIAMKFLNLMYTDPNVMNLLTYGIEGKHYQVIDEEKGIISFADGADSDTSDYAQFRGYFWGNQFLTYVWESYPPDLWEQIKAFNQEAPHSVAYGFQYNVEPVQEETYACTQIVNFYEPLLEAGVGDLEELLEQFLEELEKAGIDSIIKEKQKQLDEFLAVKEKP